MPRNPTWVPPQGNHPVWFASRCHGACVCVQGTGNLGANPRQGTRSLGGWQPPPTRHPALNIMNVLRRRPYRVECTGSLPTSEVKRRRARLVLGWGTAREDLRVLTAFSSPCLCGLFFLGYKGFYAGWVGGFRTPPCRRGHAVGVGGCSGC